MPFLWHPRPPGTRRAPQVPRFPWRLLLAASRTCPGSVRGYQDRQRPARTHVHVLASIRLCRPSRCMLASHSASAPGFTPSCGCYEWVPPPGQFLLGCWEDSFPIVEFLARNRTLTGCENPGHSGNFSPNRRIKWSKGGLRLSDRRRRSKDEER
jgi:hypothetical protein